MNRVLIRRLKQLAPTGLVALVATALLAPVTASATPYIIHLTQQGNNVVATGSGVFDLSGLSFDGDNNGRTRGGGGVVWASIGYMALGRESLVKEYSGFTGPATFGSGSGLTATSYAGSSIAFLADAGFLWLQLSDASAMTLSSSATWDNATFASLGVTPGTYVWTWGTGADQSFTLAIGNAVGVPEPETLGMFGFGVLLIGAFMGLRRRMV